MKTDTLNKLQELIEAKKSLAAQQESDTQRQNLARATEAAANLKSMIPALVREALGLTDEWERYGESDAQFLGSVAVFDGATEIARLQTQVTNSTQHAYQQELRAITASVAGFKSGYRIQLDYWEDAQDVFAEWLLEGLDHVRRKQLKERATVQQRCLNTLRTAPKGHREGIAKQIDDAKAARDVLMEIADEETKAEANRLFNGLLAACSERVRVWDERERVRAEEEEAEEAYVKALAVEMRKAKARETQNIDTCNRFQALVNTHKFPVYELKYAIPSLSTDNGYYQTEERTVYAMRRDIGLQRPNLMWWFVFDGIEIKRKMFPTLISVTEIDHVDMPNPHVGEDIEHMAYVIAISPATPAKLVQEWKAALLDDSVQPVEVPSHVTGSKKQQLWSRAYNIASSEEAEE